MNAYPNRFSSLEIGSLTVRNRLLSAAGLIIVGNRLVHPTSTQKAPKERYILGGELECWEEVTVAGA